MMLSKNSRSHKVQQICHDNDWQYQEFANFNEQIKHAHFALLNYTQNAIFRHLISANETKFGLAFNFFDCRAVEPMGIHNSSAVLFKLNLDAEFQKMHISIRPKPSIIQQDRFTSICQQQQLLELKNHYAFKHHQLFTNQQGLAEKFIQQHLKQQGYPDNLTLSSWLLAHPHLHIEISNGMLLAHQPNHLLDDGLIFDAIEHIAKVSQSLSNDTKQINTA
jgi:hypothetical protein